MAKNSNAEKIICLENSEVAVQRLIPKNIEYYGVQNKVTPLLGSFEELPFDNFFDFIISMGSIHHCNDLYKSMSKATNPFGDGQSSKRIVNHTCNFLNKM